MKSSHAHRVLGALLAVLTACASAPQAPPPDPSRTAAAFAARRLDALPADAALAGATWSLQQWFDAALRLNPQLAESRAHVFADAVRRGEIYARATCLTRDLVNEPPSSCTLNIWASRHRLGRPARQ